MAYYKSGIVNPNEYTTEEQVIGTWIDGKPLYRKIIQIDMSSVHSSNTSYIHNISNIDKIIHIYGSLITSEGFSLSLNSYNSTSYFVIVKPNKTKIEYQNVGWVGTTYVILEYTKTTD